MRKALAEDADPGPSLETKTLPATDTTRKKTATASTTTLIDLKPQTITILTKSSMWIKNTREKCPVS